MINKVLEGLPLDDLFIFDVHAHYGRSTVASLCDTFEDGILKTMNALGVNGICMSADAALNGDTEYGNGLVFNAVKNHPDRLFGYVSATPYYSQAEEFEKYFKNPNMLGIKIHALCQETEIDDERYAPAYEFANKNKLPVLFHTWNDWEVEKVISVAKKYPDASLIIGHSAVTEYTAKLCVIKACREYDNVYADTAISTTYDGAIDWIVDKIGSDKLLYGSDLPFFDARQGFGRVAMSNLSDGDKEKIFGLNAKRIFKLPENMG